MTSLVIALACGGLVLILLVALQVADRWQHEADLAGCFTVDAEYKKRVQARKRLRKALPRIGR